MDPAEISDQYSAGPFDPRKRKSKAAGVMSEKCRLCCESILGVLARKIKSTKAAGAQLRFAASVVLIPLFRQRRPHTTIATQSAISGPFLHGIGVTFPTTPGQEPGTWQDQQWKPSNGLTGYGSASSPSFICKISAPHA